MIPRNIILITTLLASWHPTAAMAEVRLASVFSDHAVLQRDKPLPVWGWADPGERIDVSLGKRKGNTTAGKDGRWIVTLEAQHGSKEEVSLIVSGTNTVTRNHLLLGDVWLCSGQSNMDMGLGDCQAPDDIRAADHPLIRHFRAEYNFATSPAKELRGQWTVCSPGSVHGFSAVGYYFARRIHAETGVPIGLITNAVGGTNIELWMSQQTLLHTPELDTYAKLMRESLADYEKQLVNTLPQIENWTKQSRMDLAAGRPIPFPPQWPEYPFSDKISKPRCVTLHNGMVAPIISMAMRGVLWYQGEANGDGHLYFEKKSAMLADWRRWFNDPNLPFYFVQLAAWQQPDDNPEGGGWGPIRDVQRRCLAIPQTGMASAVDLGDALDIHPKNKADVGERLALWALKNQYGKKDLVASGPLFRKVEIQSNTARIQFDSVGSGLMAARKIGRNPATEDQDGKLRRFAVAGNDRIWHWAEARIDGECVIVSSPKVSAPIAVRYAYSSNPEGANLYNRNGLPASPFRTDDW